MAVPKKRTTNASKGQRRSHDALSAVRMSKCPNCGQPVQSHVACKACGQYKGRQVVKVG